MNQPQLKKWQRVFVNRTLNMGLIRSLGFDMDHTLALYNRETFEALAFRETVKKFVAAGYPEDLLRLKFKPYYAIRGLLVDRERGNILKVDGHKYVKTAFHGHRMLDRDTRHKLYNSTSYRAYQFVSLDTLFALSEVQLFAEIVEYMDTHPGRIHKTYAEVYADLRQFIDLSHKDGTIKREVLREPEKYIEKDKQLPSTLMRQVESGKKLFLLTNSLWDYTHAIMEFLFSGTTGHDFSSWREAFEHVIVGAGKPGFFTGSQPFYEVVTDSNLLKLHDGLLRPSAVYHGGNVQLFQKLTGYRGDEILYVGDHIYGDIIRSKDIVNWRTLLVIEELEEELKRLVEIKGLLSKIHKAIRDREDMDEKLQYLRAKLALNARQQENARNRNEQSKLRSLEADAANFLRESQAEAQRIEVLDQQIKKMTIDKESRFHPVWGELMKSRREHSRFASQVEDYACLYTSRVSNLRFYSPFKTFSSLHEVMPHDL